MLARMFLSTFAALLVAALPPAANGQARQLPPATLFVSPRGHDSNPGDSREKPLATPAAARDRARSLRERQQDPATVIRIELADGVYELAETLVLEPRDSNTAFAAAPDARPIISGGRAPSPWRVEQLNGREVWVADAPLTAAGSPREQRWSTRELFVSGQRRTPARTPDAGYLRVEGVPDVPPGTPWHEGSRQFRFKAEDAPMWSGLAGHSNPERAEVVAFTRWVDMHLVLEGVDLETRIARTVNKTTFQLNLGDLYFIEGGRSSLDAPGEFAFEGGRLWYVPMPGESPAGTHAVIPVLRRLVEFRGTPGEHVENTTFHGLTFSHAQWWFGDSPGESWPSPDVAGFKQAAWGVPGAIYAESARACGLIDCEVSHVAGYGVEFGRGCTANTISRCRITDLGAGGIKIGEPVIRENAADRCGQTLVTNCTITDGGHLHHQAVGVWIGQSSGNVLANCGISGFEYTGISIGWTWGYGPSLADGNIVEFNDVGPLGPRAEGIEPALGDMAGVYTLGTQHGTVIRNNSFHDIAGRSIAWGIYFDEGSTGIVAENNVVLRTTHGGFHQHYGRDNTVRNNIFALGRDAQLWRTRKEDHTSFTFERNIVIGDNENWFAGDWSGGAVLRNNIYWRMGGGNIPFPGGRDLTAWLGAGLDSGSIVADPGVDLANPGRIPADSPALKQGFVPFDVSGLGPKPRSK